jgi:hypothetical protein
MSGHGKPARPPVYGFLAQYSGEETLLDAIRRARAAGYSVLEAYTPVPLHEVSHALGYKNRLPFIVLCGGLVGALVGFGLQYWVNVIDYPLNIGGRPLNSWPSFIVVTFETTILFAALAAVLGMLGLNKLPMPYHPVFNVPAFTAASRDGFFLMILSRDPRFDMAHARGLLEETECLSVEDVPH